MARLPRNVVPGLPQHVIQRGNNRQAVFFADSDYRLYLDSLQQAAAHNDCAIHAHVLMTNHVHLLVTPRGADSLSRMIQSVGRRYVRYVNGIYRRSGTLWEGRFKSAVVDSDHYLLTCMRYIELNPARAGMVDSSDGYRWSNFRANAHGTACELITSHPLYHALGDSDVERQNAYLGHFQTCIEPDILDQTRIATQGGDVIGNQHFRDQIAMALERRVDRFTHGGDRKSELFRNM